MVHEIACVVKGEIIFKWKGGKEVTLACVVTDGEMVEHDPIAISGMGELEDVTVKLSNGETHPLCLECSNHLVKSRITNDDDYGLEEIRGCVNPNCPSRV